jgi:C-terminal processing protease CtpA/Prc
MMSLTPYIKKQLEHQGELQKLPLMKVNEGVYISEVLPGSPACQAGCLSGDIILSVDGAAVQTTQQVLKIIGLRVHEPIRLQLMRRQILEQDWDGRSMRFEDHRVELVVKTGDLDSFLSSFSSRDSRSGSRS